MALIALAATAELACAQTSPSSGADVDSLQIAKSLGGGEAWLTDFSRISVPVGEIVSGGPRKDGIPAIDHPKFEGADAAASWLEPKEPVIVVELEGQTRAYPLRILIRHEIVNDEIAGHPIVVTYCPLCNTSLVFDGMLDDLRLDFGTTGRLRHSDLVMYDRQTETWWQQASGEAIVGSLLGTVLDFLPANTISWEMARNLYPDLQVLSRDTGFGRANYGANPYVGYDTQRGPYAPFFSLEIDDRFAALDRVAAIDLGDGWAAPFSELSQTGLAEGSVGEAAFVVFWSAGVASAVDASSVAGGRDVGATAVFDRQLGNTTLTFLSVDGAVRDEQTRSTWDFAGRATAGPLAGQRLTPLPHGNHFWFAWAAFRPATEVWRAP
jgi:hypothetical protein